MMSEDLNLPASLERLEINPERVEGCKNEQQNHFQVSQRSRVTPSGGAPAVASSIAPECSLQTLSLKAECPKGNCQCNKKKDRGEITVKRVSFKRPILRRSKLNRVALLRAPVLNIKEHSSVTSSASSNSNNTAVTSNSSTCQLVGSSSTTSSTCCALTKRLPHSSALSSTNNAPLVPSLSLHHSHRSLARGSDATDDCTSGATTERRRRLMTSPCANQTLALCSLQARTFSSESSSSGPPPASAAATASSNNDDDTTIDELASYFDLFVHIPKKMSLMAEMMYI